MAVAEGELVRLRGVCGGVHIRGRRWYWRMADLKGIGAIDIVYGFD